MRLSEGAVARIAVARIADARVAVARIAGIQASTTTGTGLVTGVRRRGRSAVRRSRVGSALISCVLLLAFVACNSTPTEIPADLAPEEYFQRAQEAVIERSDYSTALFYYESFLERFPDDTQRVVEAEYEIAFLNYKLGAIATAERQFESLLQRYEADDAQLLPRWPLVLTQTVLAEIQESETATAEE